MCGTNTTHCVAWVIGVAYVFLFAGVGFAGERGVLTRSAHRVPGRGGYRAVKTSAGRKILPPQSLRLAHRIVDARIQDARIRDGKYLAGVTRPLRTELKEKAQKVTEEVGRAERRARYRKRQKKREEEIRRFFLERDKTSFLH